jgi:S1-C subfamily serine protease
VLGVLVVSGRGQTLAIPADVAGRIVDSLKAHGKVRRGYLGVGAQAADLPRR